MDVKIKKHIRGILKDYSVGNKQLENELISACSEECEKQLADGIEADTAFNASVANVESALKENLKKKNKFAFPLTISCFVLIVAIMEMIAPSIYYGAQYFYVNEMSVAILALTAGLIYTAIEWRKYRWYDFVVLAVFLTSWLATLIQIGVFTLLLSPSMPDRYYAAEYVFPCIIKLLKISNTSLKPFYTQYACNLNFILSTVATVVFAAFTVKEELKLKKERTESEGAAVENGNFTALVSDIIKTNIVAKNKYVFALTVCCCALFMSVLEMLVSYIYSGDEIVYCLVVAASSVILVAALIYVTVERKKFQPIDFVVLAVLLAFWLLTLIQVTVYAFKAVNPDTGVSMYYIFPCIIKFSTYEKGNPDTIIANAYSFDFIISAILTIVMSAFYIKEKIQMKGESK
ncbi:MAG: hypothetical protein K2O67_01995 [Clostridia bacterium]|nr:hypothetical protein [Clostridia bacterium]